MELESIGREGRIHGLGPGMKSSDDVSDSDFGVAEAFLKSTNRDLRIVSPPTNDDDFFVATVGVGVGVDVVQKSPESLKRLFFIDLVHRHVDGVLDGADRHFGFGSDVDEHLLRVAGFGKFGGGYPVAAGQKTNLVVLVGGLGATEL